jgi:molybdate transport system ATP-binding protein
MGEPASLTVDIEKRLGTFHLRSRFLVRTGELIVLFGHSGSGKSLSLRAVAGLLRPDAGCIEIGGVPVFDTARGIDLPPQRRGAGMVVQNYALFPHMSVAGNVAFGLQGLSDAQRRARVRELLALLDIAGLAGRRPHEISGGQAQRVALARALAPRPRLLLLDEPFSALDTAIRVTLRRELARLKRELALTIVFVTHDLREAYNLADAIAVFDEGEVLQVGSRDEVFNQPASARVARLTEVQNIWRGRVVGAEDGVAVDLGRFELRAASGRFRPGDDVDCCIRPERVLLVRPERLETHAGQDSMLLAEIVDESAHGASHTLFFRVAGTPASDGYDVEVDIAAHPYEVLGVAAQRTWALTFPREAVHVMPATPPVAAGCP